jgi:hypothetical protein
MSLFSIIFIAIEIFLVLLIIYIFSVFPLVTNTYANFKTVMDSAVCNPTEVGIVIKQLNDLLNKPFLKSILQPLTKLFINELTAKCPVYTIAPQPT